MTGSGLIYRFDKEKKYYYAFILHGNESYSFYRRDDLDYQPIYSGRSNLIKVGEFNKLAIVGKGAIFSLHINEISVRSIEDSSFKTGDTGIIATGIGEYYFDNFTVYK